MQALVNAYHGNVFGYDHWTISKTPLENALDLLDKIPVGAGGQSIWCAIAEEG